MSFALIAPQLELPLDLLVRDVRVERDATGSVQRLLVPVGSWNQMLPGDRRQIHQHVVTLAIEAWCEDGMIVFHRPRLPLHNDARQAHARRVAFLLEAVPA